LPWRRQPDVRVAPQGDVLASVLNAMLDGVLLLDGAGHITYGNAAARRLLLVGAGTDAADEKQTTFVLPDERLAAIAGRALRGETLDETLELEAGRRTMRVSAAPLDGGGVGAVLVLHDMTEARRLDRVRQEFVANASHELMTPIGTVRALADALARGGMEDRKAARRFLKQLRVEADRLTALARDLVDLAQAQADELQLELRPTDVAEVIATVLERLHARAAKADVSLEALWEDRPPLVLADAARLEQVLLNLVQNAIKFTGSGGKVTIATETHGAELLIRVSDTGVGIAEADLPRIFERFYKVRGATGSAGGTGLGLAIVRHLVGAMQGEVTVTSEVGHGSAFTVALRRADPDQAVV
jgi:two-component system, OmpR family, phosphate regulon sensor histidine kinase PhoR